ncbi:MAG: MFS transporter [Chloroflexi bacterium]|nr:MFS transporter [Chloroflexota bacterium]
MKSSRPAAGAVDMLLRNPLILPLYLPALLLSTAQGVIIPVLPLFAQEFDAPYIWVGLILAGEGIGMLLSDLPAGVLLRRLDRRKGMLLGIGLVGLATFGLFWASSIAVALLLRVLSGVGSSLYMISRHAYLAETIMIAKRGRSVALLGGTFRMGRFIGPVLGGSIAGAFGLHAAFLAYAVCCAAGVLMIAVFNRNYIRNGEGLAEGEPVEEQQVQAQKMTLGSGLRMLRLHFRRVAMPGLGALLLQMLRTGPQIIIPLYGSAVIGLDVEQIGWILGISSALDMTLFYPAGIIMDRFGRKAAIVPSTAIMAAGVALIPLTANFAGLTVAGLLIGLGNGLGSGTMLTLGADLAPSDARSEFLGLWSLIGDAGITGAPLVIGAVADVLALQPAAWVIGGLGLLSSLVFGLFVPETLRKA